MQLIYRCGILCLLALWPLFAYALPPLNNSLEGKVKDTSGAAIAGAVITIPDLKAGTVTDASGSYKITDLPSGRYLVQVHMLSYGTITKAIAINGTTTEDFVLNESIIEKSEVVITGTSLATEQRRSPSPITIVHIKELRENASSNVIDAIAHLPGVNQVSTGPAISKPVIRGLGYNRIITVNDGIRQEGQQWGDEHGIEIDDYNVTSAEVLKGPASLAYGSDALAGVINIISEESIPAGTMRGRIVTNYQTNNGTGTVHAKIAGNTRGLTIAGYFTGKSAHDYQNRYDGYVFNSRYRNTDFGASIAINKHWGYSRLSFSSFNQTLGIAEGDRDSATGRFVKLVNNNGVAEEELVTDQDGKSLNIEVPRQRIAHRKLAWNSNFFLKNGSRLGMSLGFQQNTRKEFADVLDPDKPGLLFQLKTYTYDLKYIFPQFREWQLTAGINGMAQHNKNDGDEFLVPDYGLCDGGLYLIGKKDWNKLSVSGGLRGNFRSIMGEVLYVDSMGMKVAELQADGFTRFAAFDRSFSAIIGSLGLSYSVNKASALKFNIATGYRAPNIAELAANGVHEGTIRYEYGNKDLKAENSLEADAGYEWSSDHILLNGALFANFIRDFVYIRKLVTSTGNDSIPAINNEPGFPAFSYDQGNAFLYGGEFFIDLHPHPLDWLHLENTFSYVRGKMPDATDSTGNLPGIPPARWLAELRAQSKSVNSWMKNGYIKAGLDLNLAQNNVFSAYGTELPSKGYALLNAGLGFDVVNSRSRTVCSFTVAAQNLLDTPFQAHLSRLRYAPVNNVTGRQGIYGIGRNISLTISVPVDIN